MKEHENLKAVGEQNRILLSEIKENVDFMRGKMDRSRNGRGKQAGRVGLAALFGYLADAFLRRGGPP